MNDNHVLPTAAESEGTTVMHFSYRLTREREGYLAECVESEALGEGKTEHEAIEALRQGLEERLLRPDAVAPPSDEIATTIELTLARKEEREEPRTEPSGPGDPAPVL